MEKWRNEKLIHLIEKKNERMENEVCINLQFCFPLKKDKKVTLFLLKKLCMGTSIFYFLNSLSQRKMSTIKKRKKKVEKRKEKRKARTMPKNTHGHFGQLKH